MRSWIIKQVSMVVGDKHLPVKARYLVAEEEDDDKPRIVYPVIVCIIVLMALVVPPIILLNFPLLILRAFFIYLGDQLRKPRIVFDEFRCTACSFTRKKFKIPGTLPQDLACKKCGALHHFVEAENI